MERYVIQINRKVKTIDRYIASDLDGTLLASDTNVTKSNLDSIKNLSKKGVKTILLTGRTLYEIPLELRECDGVEYMVFSNGAGVFSKEKGIVKYKYINDDTARKIYKILSEYETFIEIYSNGIPFIEKSKFNIDEFNYYNISPDFIPELFKSRKGVESLPAVLNDESYKTEMFDVFFKSMEEREECRKKLCDAFDDISITTSMKNNLEICRVGINKGNALDELCGKLGVDINDVIVVGDSKNDISAFKTKAKKFAVSNACKEIKELADKIICSNDENIMCYLEKELV